MSSVSLAERHAEERKHGQLIASDPERVWGQGSCAGWIRVRRRAQMIIDRVGMRPGLTVVELGCGTGNYTEQFANTGVHVIAVDIAEPLIARLRERLPAVRVCCESAELLESIADHSVDAVVGNAVLHHLDVPIALRTMRRVLKPGGMICFTEPNMLNPQVALQKNIPFIKRMMGDSPHETAFLRWSIMRLIREAGFSDVNVQPFDFLHPSLPTTIASPAERIARAMERIPIVKEIAGSLIISARVPSSSETDFHKRD